MTSLMLGEHKALFLDLHQGVVEFYFLCVHDIQPIEFNTVQKENHMELSDLL